MMKKLHGSKGFTLIELMIVILIIAILVAIAIPVYLAAKGDAEKNTCKANLRSVDGMVNVYYIDGDPMVYPGTVANMVPSALKDTPVCPDSGGGAYVLVSTALEPVPECSCPNIVDHTL